MDNLMTFLDATTGDDELRSGLGRAIQGLKGVEQGEAIVAYANANGFALSLDDFRIPGDAAEGELSDDELAAVGGGVAVIQRPDGEILEVHFPTGIH